MMMLKKCGNCKITKNTCEFYKDRTRKDGNDRICKICKNTKRVLYYYSHRDKAVISNRIWTKQNNHKRKHLLRENEENYRKRNAEKVKAQALARREYPIAEKCSIDLCALKGQRHHNDYSKPLDIIWLCHKHHKELHRIEKEVV